MFCKTCDALLSAYKHAVKPYVDAELSCRAVLGDNFRLGLKKLQRLHKTCQDANDALTAHWRQDHGKLAGLKKVISRLPRCSDVA